METFNSENGLPGDGGDEELWADMLALLAPAEDTRMGTLDIAMGDEQAPVGVQSKHRNGHAGAWTRGSETGSDPSLIYANDSAKQTVSYPFVEASGASLAPHTAWLAPSPIIHPTHVSAAAMAASVPPVAQAPAIESLWASSEPAVLEETVSQPLNANAIETRRLKNREYMRRARRRQREDLKRVKATVESLEKQYADMCLFAKERAGGAGQIHVPSSPSSPSSALSAPWRMQKEQMKTQPLQTQAQKLFAQAFDAVKQLGAENLYLRAAIQEKASWNPHMRRIFETAPAYVLNNGLGSPQAAPVRMACLPLDILDPDAARSIFGFSPLTEADMSALMLDNSYQIHYIRSQLEAGLQGGESQMPARQVFGWEVVQRVTRNSIMEYMFTKRFSGRSASDIMRKTWANDMELEKFKKVKRDVERLEVLQELNANAYILGRDVRAPDKGVVFRSVFLRYLIETRMTLPNPKRKPSVLNESDSELEEKDAPPLNASGFILGTHSISRDWSGPGGAEPKLLERDPAGRDRLLWADLAMSIEFLDVEDPATGETYQRARWIGCTDYKTRADALRNMADVLSGCLRWELLMISPALNLVSLQL